MPLTLTRADAIQLGLLHYFSGKPCPAGHLGFRYVDAGCVECHRLQRKTESGSRQSAGAVERQRKRFRNYEAKRGGYAPAPPESECPPRPESGRCQCCGEVKPLCLDHCHVSGMFRGWLCDKCNRGIGALGDDLRGVQLAIQYLKRSATI